MTRAILLLALALPTACAAPQGDLPSLERRPAEAIDPRLPVGSDEPAPGRVTMASEILRLEAAAREGIAAYDAMLPRTREMVAAAGDTGSESWVGASEQLSRLEAARQPFSNALADLDALVTDRIERGDWVSPADREAVGMVLARYGPVDREQAATIEAMGRRLAP